MTDADLRPLLAFYQRGRREGDFDNGIQKALGAMLVSPDFLFRVEQDPKGAAPGTVYRISDHELASRLSFFLWSSIPDDELLKLADERQVEGPRGAPAAGAPDARRSAVAGAGQQFRRAVAATAESRRHAKPDPEIFPEFDESLRRSFRQETELFFESILRENRSVLDLLGRELHVPEPAAGRALRHSEDLRLAVPQGRADEPESRRAAGARQRADGDVVSEPDFRRAARQVDPGESARRTASAASAAISRN